MARLATTLGLMTRLYTDTRVNVRWLLQVFQRLDMARIGLEIPLDPRILPYLSGDFREKMEAVHPVRLEYHRNVGRSNIELPDALEMVKVMVSEPSAEKAPTWDIEVEGTGNFVSEGFIVHNSKLTMKYPAVWLMEPGAHGEVLSIAFAGKGQVLDAGSKIVHVRAGHQFRS